MFAYYRLLQPGAELIAPRIMGAY